MPIKHPEAFGRRSVTAVVVLIGALVSVAAASLAGKTQARVIMVHMSPYCGCCGGWIDHMRENGFSLMVREVEDLEPIRAEHGVTDELMSCHTAVVDGYVVEGHVPATDVRRLLQERPEAKGLAAPGMPAGSPGMEGAGKESYNVFLFTEDGDTRVFASH
jgi:hypothetical protein